MAEEYRIPLVEERARLIKSRRDTGRVRVTLQRTDETRVLSDALSQRRVETVRIPINKVVTEEPAPRVEDGVLIVPVVEEELIVTKRLVLKEELHLTLISQLEPVEIPVVLRRNHAVVVRSGAEGATPDHNGAGAAPMNRTVTAFYTSRDQAEDVRRQLAAIGVADRDIDIVTSESHAQHQDEKGGFFSFLGRLFIPNEDRSVYNEGLTRGHAMLTAHLDEDDADRAIAVLEQSDAMDLDLHEAEWRTATSKRGTDDGYGYDQNLSAGMGSASVIADSEAADRSPTLAVPMDMTTIAVAESDAVMAEDRIEPAPRTPVTTTGTEEVIPVVQEQLRVGKREVGRGGVRVRSYVVETPVEEQVSLRSERVQIERRPVNEAVANADTLLREGDVEFVETEEVAVVAKEAVVTEEIIVRKDASERVETVHDTVRRTEVDVDDTRPGA